LLARRCSIDNSAIGDNGTICFHHEKILLSHYESLQKYCRMTNRNGF
jgi:hypothetical protein